MDQSFFGRRDQRQREHLTESPSERLAQRVRAIEAERLADQLMRNEAFMRALAVRPRGIEGRKQRAMEIATLKAWYARS